MKKRWISNITDGLNNRKSKIIKELNTLEKGSYLVKETIKHQYSCSQLVGRSNPIYRYEMEHARITDKEEIITRIKCETTDRDEFRNVVDEGFSLVKEEDE
ncbi:MAG: hypothetical protein HXS48_08050 [Theionarchaea archaeon]|nr:hypothetical protein [Theionarchaea archaeon]